MGELEKLKSEIKEYCTKHDLILYEVDGDDLTVGSTIEYTSGDYKDFLKVAEIVGAKLIYYEEAFGETKEDEIAEIYIGFAYNGVLHTLSTPASWYEKELEETYEEDEESENKSFARAIDVDRANTKKGIDYIKNNSEESIESEFSNFIKKEYPETLTGEIEVSNAYWQFWQGKGVYNEFSLDMRLKMKVDKIENAVETEITKERFEQEKALIPGLTKECIEWARNLGLKRISIPNLNTFLTDKKVKLTKLSFDILHTQVNITLKQ